jgi:SnoaL-like domain
MSRTSEEPDPAVVVRRLQDATNAHDVEAIVACFAPGYRNETPVHPSRSFEGNDQVRRNWTQILAAIPDLVAEIVGSATEADTVWTEWRHRGTRPDGSAHLMRGVVIFAIAGGLIESARFFLEPVDSDPEDVNAEDVNAAVRRQVVSGAPS